MENQKNDNLNLLEAVVQNTEMGKNTLEQIVPMTDDVQFKAELLAAAGYPLEWRSYPMEHSLCLPEVRDIEDWLARVLAA